MYFDFLIHAKLPNDNSKEFGEWERLHSICTAAEKNAKVDPDTCVVNIRQALEILFSGILYENGYEELPETLAAIIEESEKISGLWNSPDGVKKFQNLRREANTIVHIEKGRKGDGRYVVRDRHENVDHASQMTIRLYVNMRQLFRIPTKRPQDYLTPKELPLGEFCVVKTIDKRPYESIAGDFKYIVCKNNDNITTYAYVRPFLKTKEKTVFSDRDIETQNFLKNMRSTGNIIVGDEIRTSEYCNLKYLKYDIQENTKTLDELAGKVNSYELLDIIEQVTNGLSKLATATINIHHRGIRPTCIFVSHFEDGYEAKIGCFETAKIDYKEKSIETVGAWVKDIRQDEVYTHPRLFSEAEHDNKDWEAGDVYSLAIVLLACLDPSVEKRGVADVSVLYDYYSDGFVDEIEAIISAASLSQIPTLKEFDIMIQKELNNERN